MNGQEITINHGDLLFASLFNQYFVPPAKTENLKYFKVLFDENTLALLPQRFSFLINPLNNQKINLNAAAKKRIKNIFEILNQMLYTERH